MDIGTGKKMLAGWRWRWRDRRHTSPPAARAALLGSVHGSWLHAPPLQLGVRHSRSAPVQMHASRHGGDLADEAQAAVAVVQKAMQLCLSLASEMGVSAPSKGKQMDSSSTETGVSLIKEGDSTPVTAADFAIQGFVASELRRLFPSDRFMGEEDAGDLRENADLCELALSLCARTGGPTERDAFLSFVDRQVSPQVSLSLFPLNLSQPIFSNWPHRVFPYWSHINTPLPPPPPNFTRSGLEADRRQGERVWVLDPIDGTKGFMTGCGYVVGLALLVDGEPVVGAMGVPVEIETPPLVVAVKGHGVRWYGASGEAPVPYETTIPEWAAEDAAAPPWLLSPSNAEGICTPFGPGSPPETLCCGAMIKYFATAAGRVSGFVQYKEELKTWDHACGVICVNESGGRAVDGRGAAVRFPGRHFKVAGGIVCSSKHATEQMREKLLASAELSGEQ